MNRHRVWPSGQPVGGPNRRRLRIPSALYYGVIVFFAIVGAMVLAVSA